MRRSRSAIDRDEHLVGVVDEVGERPHAELPGAELDRARQDVRGGEMGGPEQLGQRGERTAGSVQLPDPA